MQYDDADYEFSQIKHKTTAKNIPVWLSKIARGIRERDNFVYNCDDLLKQLQDGKVDKEFWNKIFIMNPIN